MTDCTYYDGCIQREEYERDEKTKFMVCSKCGWAYRIYDGELDMFLKDGCISCGYKGDIEKLAKSIYKVLH